MSDPPSLLERLKKARIVQVLVVYLAACWGVLQLVGTLMDMLTLPEWLGPVTLVLLSVGLLVVGATAWVQSLDSTTEAEEAGERPTDWEIAPGDAVASLKAGRLPALTWGRAIMGGVVAISLAVGAAGAFVLMGGGGGIIGPAAAGASGVAEGIAVLPFDTRGEELSIYREGMVDLLSASFDGVGGYRTIDSRTVLARWSEEVGAETRADLEAALRAAGRTGARYAILGSMIPAGSVVRAQVDIYDLGDGSSLGRASIDGSAEDILELVDGLSVEIARTLLGAAGERVASERRLASITTHSVAALKDYLEGERLYRLGEFEASAEALDRAIAEDSTFALAYARSAAVLGWVSGANARSLEMRERANELADRLAPREATLTRARSLYNTGDPEAIEILEEYTQRYPDDAEAWYDLGDSRYHMTLDMQGIYHASRDEVWSALRTSAELDPSFSPYQIHLVDLAFSAGDSAAARVAIGAYRAANGAANQYSNYWDAGFDILFGDEATMRAGVEAALELPELLRALGLLGRLVGVDDVPRELALVRAWVDRDPGPASIRRLTEVLERAGRMGELREILVDGSRPLDPLDRAGGLSVLDQAYGLGDNVLVHDLLASVDCEPGSMDCLALAVQRAFHGSHSGHEEEAREALASIEPASEALLANPELAGNPTLTLAIGSVAVQAPALVAFAGGDPQAAYDRFVALAEEDVPLDHMIAAWAADEVGDHEMAERYYLAQAWRNGAPFATYRLARMYEEIGRPDDALVQYRRLARMWAEADADFQPWLEVQEALGRLGG